MRMLCGSEVSNQPALCSLILEIMLGPSLVVQTDMLFVPHRCESDLTFEVHHWCDEHQS